MKYGNFSVRTAQEMEAITDLLDPLHEDVPEIMAITINKIV
jgi:hypothetical protein